MKKPARYTPSLTLIKGVCMLGGIYTDEKCFICGKNLKDDGKRSLSCPQHPSQKATKFRVHFGKVKRRFRSYIEAERFLTGLRYKTDENTFDARDYFIDKPLIFNTLSNKWLDVKKQTVKPKSYNNLQNYMRKASESWGNMNVKQIGFAEIEDLFLLHNQKVSSKTLSNMKSCYHDFFKWLKRRELIKRIPPFPEISVKLAFRKIIGKETQQELLNELGRIAPFRVWLGIKWLCTYISIRPGELIKIREQDIDLENRYFYIHHSKTGDTKPVPILNEDIDLINQYGLTFPRSYFFRHDERKKGIKQGSKYGEKYFYKWWKKACDNLGIEGVDLYGGTRHSSVVALREHFSPEQIKQGTMHQTNKAFERYFRIEAEDVRNIYSQASLKPKKVGNKITTIACKKKV